MRVTVVSPYSAAYPNPIALQSGAAVTVEREDPDFPGWHWCQCANGTSGWVHESFLASTAGSTTALHDYCARELTVSVSAAGTMLRELSGWALVRLDSGEEGWLPVANVQRNG